MVVEVEDRGGGLGLGRGGLGPPYSEEGNGVWGGYYRRETKRVTASRGGWRRGGAGGGVDTGDVVEQAPRLREEVVARLHDPELEFDDGLVQVDVALDDRFRPPARCHSPRARSGARRGCGEGRGTHPARATGDRGAGRVAEVHAVEQVREPVRDVDSHHGLEEEEEEELE